MEFQAVEKAAEKYSCRHLISGVGPAMTAHVLTRNLEALRNSRPRAILLCGIGGMYAKPGEFSPQVLLAEREVFADFGRCSENAVSSLKIDGKALETAFDLQDSWYRVISRDRILSEDFRTASMATVSCASADMHRADLISRMFDVQVENMEGAAAAMVCRFYDIPLFEFRAVSNIAGETNHAKWHIHQALDLLASEVDRFLGLLYT